MATTPSYLGKGQYQGSPNPDFNTIQNGQAVQGAEGMNWYHTGALGGSANYGGNDWIQAKPGDINANVGPSAPTAAPQLGPQTAQQAITQPATVGATTAQGQPQSVAGAFQQALVNRLNAPAPSASDPAISGAITANKGAEQRGLEQTRAMLAERAASQGLDQNAFNSQLLGAQQQSAGRQASFTGNAVMSQAQQQAQQVEAALGLGGQMLSQQDQLALQDRLAQLNAQIQRESIAQQGSLGQGDLSLRRDLGEGGLNLSLLSTLLNNQQFGQNLGAQLGEFGAGLNQQALLAGLDRLSNS